MSSLADKLAEQAAKQDLQARQGKKDAAKPYDPKEDDSKTRQKIATWFVIGYFALFTILVLGIPLYNAFVLPEPQALDLESTLQLFGSIIGTSLGFVVGYYFKSEHK